MWGERVQHANHGQQRFLQQRAILLALLRRAGQLVHQLHHGGDRGVEGLTAADIVGYLGDGFVQIAAQRFLIFVQRRYVERLYRAFST